MRTARVRIRDLRDRRWLRCSVPDVVAGVSRILRGWASYFRRGNSTRHFHAIDWYMMERLSLFLSKKHGRAGRRHGGYLLACSANMGLRRLVGTVVQGQIAHAVR